MLTPATLGALLDRYRDGTDAAIAAIRAAADAGRLDHRAGDGWSAREVAHHLADSELTAAIRLRRLLAEDAPDIPAYDEEEFARRLHYDRPVDASLDAMRAARVSSHEVLTRLSPGDWARAGTHPEHGAYSVADWLRVYAEHPYDHAAQARAAAGLGG